MALAHVVENRVEAAYRRGDLFGKRRAMMQEWADWCGRPTPAVGAMPKAPAPHIASDPDALVEATR